MTKNLHTNAMTIDIMGVAYQIRSDESAEYVQGLADMVNSKTREIREQTATVDSLKCAVLTALNLADDLCKLNIEFQSYRRLTEKQQGRMIKTIDSALESGG